MQKHLLTKIACALVCASLCGGAVAQTARTLSCETHITSSRDNQTQTGIDRVWIKGTSKIRRERTVGNQSQIMIVNGNDVWILQPAQKKGGHQRLNAQQAAAFSKNNKMPPMGATLVAELAKKGEKKTGREKVDGVFCDVYKMTKEGMTETVWVLPGPEGMVRRQAMEGTMRAAPGPGQPMGTHTFRSVTDFDWKVGKPIDDALFRPPAGIAIQEMSAPGANPGVPGAPKR